MRGADFALACGGAELAPAIPAPASEQILSRRPLRLARSAPARPFRESRRSTFSCLSSFLPRLPSSSASHRVRLRAPHFLTPSFTLRPLRPAHPPLPPSSLSGPLGRPIHHTRFSYQREGGFRESRRVGGEVREAERQMDEAGRYVGWVGVMGG